MLALRGIALLGGALVLGGCGRSYFSPVIAAQSAASSTVCDPFGGAGANTGNPNNGLVSLLTYLPSSSPAASSCASGNCSALNVAAFAPGAPNVVTEGATIYLSDLDVPTQNFSAGFPSGTGSLLTDDTGNPLLQYFSLQNIDSQLMLNAGQAAGNYQLAVLSDDGSVLSIDPTNSGDYQVLINNDGAHPNTLGCATTPVQLTPGTPVSIRVDYFQGPKYSLALILLWRPITGTISSDPECGIQEGDGYYFDEGTTPSTPTSNYAALLNRGWSVVPAANFYLPPGSATNPCSTK